MTALNNFFKSIGNLFKKKQAYTCRQSETDGKYYCYEIIEGGYVHVGGPYNTPQDCQASIDERNT